MNSFSQVELRPKEPRVLMVFDNSIEPCKVCGECYWLIEEGQPTKCLTCLLLLSGKDFIILFGWKIMKSSRQFITCRI